MYYGQWEGVRRMTIGGPRLKKVGNRWIKINIYEVIKDLRIEIP